MNKSSSEEKEVAGYGMADLIKAPVEPPEPLHTEGKAETSNHKVKGLIVMGIGLITIGILFGLLLGVILGAILVAIGTGIIVTSVFVPIT